MPTHAYEGTLRPDLSELLRCIGDLQQLTSLQLSLAGCKGLMVDSDLVLLGKSLRQLPKLRQLFLDLSGAKRIFYSGVRINREKVVGYDTAQGFVKALGVRALSDPEDGDGFDDVRLEEESRSHHKLKQHQNICPSMDVEDDVGLQVEKPQSTVWLTHLEEMAIKRSFRLPMGCQGFHKGCPRLY
eukprot:g19659.t1